MRCKGVVDWEPPARRGKHEPKDKKKGVPGASRSTGTPTKECGGVLLSHTLSSAVPSPRPGLSFRVRKGTGRLTWAMTTAKPIQRSDGNHRTGGTETSHTTDSDRGGPGTGQRTRAKTLHRYRHRDHKKQRSLPSNERNHHRTRPNPPQRKGLESVPRSPVSTGRLHPSRGFHLRPIEHVFNMRATTVQDRTES